MSTGKHWHSALIIGDEGDDVSASVGGLGGTGKEAGLLSRRSNQASGDPDIPWRWQQLTPIHESRSRRPGMLLLGRDRVLVAGGERRSVELLHLPRGDKDRGVWTLLTQLLENDLYTTFLVNYNNDALAIGSLRTRLVKFEKSSN